MSYRKGVIAAKPVRAKKYDLRSSFCPQGSITSSAYSFGHFIYKLFNHVPFPELCTPSRRNRRNRRRSAAYAGGYPWDGSSASCPFEVQVFVLDQLLAYAKAEMQELEIPIAQQLSKTARPLELPARRDTEKVSLKEAPLLTKSYDTIVALDLGHLQESSG